MAKKQQIILLHGSEKFTNKDLIVQGELVVEHGSEGAKLHTLDKDKEVATFITEKAIDNKIATINNTTNGLSNLISANAAAISANTAAIETNAAAISANTAAIETNAAAISANTDAINTENERAISAETALSTRVSAIENDYLKASDKTELNNKITANTSAINTEKERAISAETALSGRIETIENDYLTSTDKTDLQGQIEAITADYLTSTDKTDLNNKITANTANITANANAITAETSARESADTALSTRIKTIEDDYLKEEDKEALQANIDQKVNTSAYTAYTAQTNSDITDLKNVVSGYTGANAIKNAVDSKLAINDFNNYSAATDGVISGLQTQIDNLDNTYATDAQLNTAVTTLEGKITAAQKAASSKVVEGTDEGENMTITSASGTDGSVTYTVNLTNVASATELSALEGKVDILNGEATVSGSVKHTVAEEIAKVVAGADEDFDTLKEIADWIANDTTGAASMSNDITELKSTLSGFSSSSTVKATTDGLADRVNTIETTYATDKELSDKATELEGKITALTTGQVATNKTNIENLQNNKLDKSTFNTYTGDTNSKIEAINQTISGLGSTYATDKELSDAVSALEGKITAKSVVVNANDTFVTVTPTTSETTGTTYMISTSGIASQTSLEGEKTARQNADKEINDKIGGNYSSESTVHAAITANANAITAETSARETADTTLQTNIDKKADKTTVEGVDSRLKTVEGKYITAATITNSSVNKITATAANNVITFNFDEMVIDGGTYL